MQKQYFITGHPRSGTGYMAKLFQKNNIDIGHEQMGEQGISSWQFAVNSQVYPFEHDGLVRSDYSFDQIIHVIRDPMACINSVAFTERPSEAFRMKYLVLYGNVFERAVLSVIGWNKLVHSLAPSITIQVEKAASHFGFTDVPRQNKRAHSSLTYDELIYCIAPGIRHELDLFYDFYRSL